MGCMITGPAPRDCPFAILGLQPAFELDRGELQQRWLELSATLHPDRAADPEQAAIRLAVVNRAKQILEDDEQRAAALLRRLGGPGADTDKSLPDGFLEEMLETRDRLESAKASNDPRAAEELTLWADEKRAGIMRRVRDLFLLEAQAPDRRAEVLHAVRRELNAWRYIERLREQLADVAGP